MTFWEKFRWVYIKIWWFLNSISFFYELFNWIRWVGNWPKLSRELLETLDQWDRSVPCNVFSGWHGANLWTGCLKTSKNENDKKLASVWLFENCWNEIEKDLEELLSKESSKTWKGVWKWRGKLDQLLLELERVWKSRALQDLKCQVLALVGPLVFNPCAQ